MPLSSQTLSRYVVAMNIKHPSNDAKLWHQPPDPSDRLVPGYEAWLEAEIAAGLAEAEAGKVSTLDEVRKEFGLE